MKNAEVLKMVVVTAEVVPEAVLNAVGDFSFLTSYYMPLVVMACLIVGYCIKHIAWLDTVANEYIPTIMVVLGAIVGCLASGFSLEVAIHGAFSGLASTGLHQLFVQFIEKSKNEGSDH